MKWKNIKLGRKFFIAFGTIIFLLAGVVYWSFNGIKKIVFNANEVIEGNMLRTDLEQKYVQHLKWAQEVNRLLIDDNVTELNVQTDYTKCDFGKWYYGEGRKKVEEMVPELTSILNEFEQPHQHLHESAIKIKDTFIQGDMNLANRLQEAKCDHVAWISNLKDVFSEGNTKTTIYVEKDYNLCGFGKWLKSDELQHSMKNSPEFEAIIQKIILPHEMLHNSAIKIEEYLRENKREKAYEYFKDVSLIQMKDILSDLNEAIAWTDKTINGMENANKIYNTETMTYLGEMGNLFHQTIDDSKKYILTDQTMISEANKTKSGVIIIGIFAIFFAVIMAYIIVSGILTPIKEGVQLANEVASGNLSAKTNIEQNDEIGKLIVAIKKMINKLKDIVSEIRSGADNIANASIQLSAGSQQLSQGASEQASSVEEVSSSMEEMAANIQQNTENAQQTQSIAIKAANEIKKGSEATNTAVASMKNIAEKISIINEIAFQTNILALNAAVEAARAGEHGKGFAVVAAEVRKLAERSKIAAQEIDEVSRTGVKISEEAGKQLIERVPEIEKTAQLVQEITAASHEQNSGAAQVNNAIQQINQSTQQNAASSEEMATNAEELSSQADQLKVTIGYFYFDELKTSKKTEKKINIPEKKDKKVEYSEMQTLNEKDMDKEFVHF